MLAGLIGHDPWKADEPYVFGTVEGVLETGDWIVPRVAGEPFVEKPPLYAVTGALLARLAAPWLPPHDGARLATGVFLALACIAVGAAARNAWGPGSSRYAVLALVANLGLVAHAHAMLPDVPVLTGVAFAAWGFALLPGRPLGAGWLIGTGAGLSFMAKGLLAPAAIGCTAVLLPLLFAGWRRRAYAIAMLMALCSVVPWVLVWPIKLHAISPPLFDEWFWLNNIGRFTGSSVPVLGAAHAAGEWPRTLPWFTFPSLPLALLMLWSKRNELMDSPPVQYCLVTSGVIMAALVVSASARDNYALPLLAPLAILATPAATALPARIDKGWAAAAAILFGALAAAVWIAWMAATASDGASRALSGALPLSFFRTRPQVAPVAAALALTVVAIAVPLAHRSPGQGLIAWVAGLSLCWGLLLFLWEPWLDASKSYRGMFLSMGGTMPAAHCVASRGMGESERAMLHYVLHIDTRRVEVDPGSARDCDLLLVQGVAAVPPDELASPQWRAIWNGARLADRRERFWLFARAPG